MANYLDDLRAGLMLVTPTRRLAGLVADRYHVAMLGAGQVTWEAPPVLPFAGWLADTFQHMAMAAHPNAAGKILLSLEQERVLWEQVVREGNATDADQAEDLAALAMNAWATAILWELPLATIAQSGGRQEVRAFSHWASRFAQRCRDLDAIDQHAFAAQLVAPGSPPFDRQARFRFFGYLRLPSLLKQIAGDDDSVSQTRHEQAHSESFEYRVFANRDIELSAAMRWAKDQKRARPDASVNVALAGVRRIDTNLEQRLQRAFLAAGEDEDNVQRTQLYCPVALSLAELALIQSALLILDSRRSRPWDDVSRLLLSPYLGEADLEREQRALLDEQLRRRSNVEVSITSVIELARNGRIKCPALAARLEAVARCMEERPRRQRMGDWMTFADKLLTAAGWPGERELNNTEHVALAEWHRVMDATAQLDAVLPTCDWRAAFAKWRAILRSRQLQPPIEINAVQVVTLEEAAFLDADALWVAGLHDGALPDSTEVSPLLPFALQREYGLPGADPNVELVQADATLGQLRGGNRQAIWSYARLEGETPRRKLAKISCLEVATTPVFAWPRSAVRNQYEIIDDTFGAEMRGDGAVSGGVGLFTDQAACPMRAFGRHRLGAKSPEDATPGLNAMQRGSLTHAVMARFWQQIKSSARLQATGENEVQQILAGCAQAVVDEFRTRYHLLDSYWALECERLRELGREWLQLEMERGDFDVIACEQPQTATVGTQTINTRVDRIDRLPNGEVLIIDYKTGDVARASWSVPRPDQPQLPIYAVTAGGERVGGIAYGRLKKGGCKIVDEPTGIASDSNRIKDSAVGWEVQTDTWRIALEELANEIQLGFAVADPKRGATTCRYCDLQCFCRIQESQPHNVQVYGDDD